MSARVLATSLSILSVTRCPLTEQVFLPSTVIVLFNISSSATSISYSLSILWVLSLIFSNTAVTLAVFSPYLIKVLSALLPKTKLKLSIIIDLPAPVSPDRILSP